MLARAVARDKHWPIEIDSPPPEFVFQAGKAFVHAGVLIPEGIPVYRYEPFKGGRSIAESMEIIPGMHPNGNRGCSPSGLVVRLRR